jgi:hypothetical protein
VDDFTDLSGDGPDRRPGRASDWWLGLIGGLTLFAALIVPAYVQIFCLTCRCP